jgi:hypothetical protein
MTRLIGGTCQGFGGIVAALLTCLGLVAGLLFPAAAEAAIPPIDPRPPVVGVLAARAAAHDTWVAAHHRPGYGGQIDLVTETPDTMDVHGYTAQGDSAISTGEYLASQAFRYAATGDPVAKANAVSAAQTLHTFLEITDYTNPAEVAPNRVGTAFIARYAAPARPPFTNANFVWESGTCTPAEDCHLITSGPYAGSYWRGDTSRDQYIGWFFGYAVAFDLVDDPAMRAMIAADVSRVITQLRADGYIIRDRDGSRTVAAEVGYSMRLAWHLIAAHVTGDPALRRIYEQEALGWAILNALTTFHEYNLYREYFAFMNAYLVYYPLLRLETDRTRRNMFANVFRSRLHRLVAGTHNVFFEYVNAAVGTPDPVVLAAALADLHLLSGPPLRHVPRTLPPAQLDPTSVRLDKLERMLRKYIPDLPDLFELRTLAPRPLDQRCSGGSIWSHSPYPANCDQSNWDGYFRIVYPGTAYLLAYWMGRYHGFVPEEA